MTESMPMFCVNSDLEGFMSQLEQAVVHSQLFKSKPVDRNEVFCPLSKWWNGDKLQPSGFIEELETKRPLLENNDCNQRWVQLVDPAGTDKLSEDVLHIVYRQRETIAHACENPDAFFLVLVDDIREANEVKQLVLEQGDWGNVDIILLDVFLDPHNCIDLLHVLAFKSALRQSSVY